MFSDVFTVDLYTPKRPNVNEPGLASDSNLIHCSTASDKCGSANSGAIINFCKSYIGCYTKFRNYKMLTTNFGEWFIFHRRIKFQKYNVSKLLLKTGLLVVSRDFIFNISSYVALPYV